jgi:chromosome transmission fidelity protein 1
VVSIGRAIRHKDDYAVILLLDHRYLRSSVKSKLPGWIGDKLKVMDRFGPAFAAIRQVIALFVTLGLMGCIAYFI